MKRIRSYLMMFFLLVSLAVAGQYDPSKVCTLEDGQLVFRIDRRWTKEQLKEICELFDLDTLLIERAIRGDRSYTHNEVTWNIRPAGASLIEITKAMQPSKVGKGTRDIFILDDRWIKPEFLEFRESASYGVNKFTLYTVFNYFNGMARFFLPGYLSAENVNLSGTFNNWSTMETPMLRTDSGWIVSVRLKPGRYMYKYIIDGRWTPDPYNRLKEKYDNDNSVVFCPNHIFRLRGYTDARKVLVAGSFNGWNPSELKMVRIPGGWGLRIFLHEGTHAYKFIVDDEWILDPGNKISRPDGMGNVNSFLSIGDTMYFRLRGNPNAEKVAVAGNFNGWNQGELFMERVNGGWQLPYVLPAGNYEYKFIVDGKWMTDPDNPVIVGSAPSDNSFLTVKPNHTFLLDDYADAQQVIVTGNFSSWNPHNYPMKKQNGAWTFSLYLKPGKCTYKFIVDGTWITDPANDQWENNEYGTKNSVRWITP